MILYFVKLNGRFMLCLSLVLLVTGRVSSLLRTRTWNAFGRVPRKQKPPQGFPRADVVALCSVFQCLFNLLGDSILRILISRKIA